MKLRNRSGDGRPGGVAESVAGGTQNGALAARHAALLDSIATTIPDALLLARTKGWDDGWEAARLGLPKSANPVPPSV